MLSQNSKQETKMTYWGKEEKYQKRSSGVQ